MKQLQVVIVGGGFAGIRAARNLEHDPNFSVTLISDRPAWEYHAALYRTSTGHSPLAVRVPLAQIFADSKVRVVCGKADALDETKQVVKTEDGKEYHYDKLIMALGSVTAYFNIKGLEDFSYGIKSVSEAMRLRAHLHEELTGDGKADLNYVVVGAGATGVELAAEMVSYLKHLRKRYGATSKAFHVNIVEAAPRILPALPEKYARKVAARLKKLGIKVFTSTAVKAETANELQLPEGNIETHTVVWTAGVTNNPFYAKCATAFSCGQGGKITVDSQLLASKNIYVLGDSAMTTHTGWAQTAVYDANFVTHNLQRGLADRAPLEYKPGKPIAAIPVGPSWCAVNADSWQLYGYPGWLFRRYIDLKLYLSLLRPGLAVKTWLIGTKEED